MIPFNPKPNGMLKHTAVLMIILCISQNCLGLLEDPSRERSQERQSLAADKFGRESLKSSPYIRDVRADSRQSRIDASDIRTDFREIRTELHNGFSRDFGQETNQVRDWEHAQLRTRSNQDRENTRQRGRVDERRSQNPEDAALLGTSASRCSRRMSFEETQPTTIDRQRQFGERIRYFRSGEDRTLESRSSSRRALERRDDSSRRTRDVSERSCPNFRHLERLSQKTDKNRRDQQRTPLQRDNSDILNVRDLESTRRIIHDANVEHRDTNFGERQQRRFRDREDSRQNSPDFEGTRRLINQRQVREINLERARNLESMRFAHRNALQSRVELRRVSLNEESRERGKTSDGRISFRGRFAEPRKNEPISSPNAEREESRERVAGNIRVQSEDATRAPNNQISQPAKERTVVENADTETKSRSNMLVGYNRIVSDSFDANNLGDLPARTGKYGDTWMNVAEALLVLALLGQVIGGTSKGKFRCLSWPGLFPKQKVL